MIMDDFLEFADAGSVGVPNNNIKNIGSSVDLTTVRDIGQGKPMYLVIQITTDITGASAVVNFKLVSDSTATPSVTALAASFHGQSPSLTGTDLDAGEMCVIPLAPGGLGSFDTYERYLGVQIEETSGNAVTAGAINAFLTSDPPAMPTKLSQDFADAAN